MFRSKRHVDAVWIGIARELRRSGSLFGRERPTDPAGWIGAQCFDPSGGKDPFWIRRREQSPHGDKKADVWSSALRLRQALAQKTKETTGDDTPEDKTTNERVLDWLHGEELYL